MAKKLYDEDVKLNNEDIIPYQNEEDNTYSSKKAKTKGQVVLILKGKIYIEYGNGLGTFIYFVKGEHDKLKIGDPIAF